MIAVTASPRLDGPSRGGDDWGRGHPFVWTAPAAGAMIAVTARLAWMAQPRGDDWKRRLLSPGRPQPVRRGMWLEDRMEYFACSGPGAMQAIADSISTGYTHAAAMGALLVSSVALFALRRHGRPVVPAVLACLLLLHPAWTISAISGDCGSTKRYVSYVFTIVGCVCVFCQLGQTILGSTRLRRLRDEDDAYGPLK